MDTAVLDEISACLPRGRTPFFYFKDRYALLLLGHLAGDGCSISELKKGPAAPLLNRPLVRDVLATAGGGVVRRSHFDCVWDASVEPFLLTIDRWGCNERRDNASNPWWQTSRPGWNLVLQLNFSMKHDRVFRRTLKSKPGECAVNFDLHPVMKAGAREFFRETLAWARIDLDFETGEALIEEVQSDWMKNARWTLQDRVTQQLAELAGEPLSARTKIERQAERYMEKILPGYRRIWQEAMLSAAIGFVRDELGLNVVYYHTYEGGLVAKQLSREYGPPRSLYTDLPRRFCFTRTQQGPRFLYEDERLARRRRHRPGMRVPSRRERLAGLWWHKLEI